MVLDIVPLATIGGCSLIGMCGRLWGGPEQRIATCQRPELTTAPLTARLRTHLRRAGGRAQGHAIPGKASAAELLPIQFADRKSTRLNSSHLAISYAVFC